ILLTDVSLFLDPPPSDYYTLSLHDALPISQTKSSLRSVMSLRQQAENFAQENLKRGKVRNPVLRYIQKQRIKREYIRSYRATLRSEEHTSELQSRENLVCRLLLEKKKLVNI